MPYSHAGLYGILILSPARPLIISQGLLKSNKEKPLGYNNYSKNRLNSNINLHLIGLYAVEC